MKTRQLLLSSVIGILSISLLFSAFLNNENRKYISRKDLQNSYSANEAMKWNLSRKVNQNTGKIEIQDIINAEYQVDLLASNNSNKSLGLEWTSLGPDNQGGRTRALLIDKNNPSVMYAGGVSGGLWKSTTGGLSWVKISDQFDNIAISCICQDASGYIYFGTGEYFASPYGVDVNSGMIGQGIWKSTTIDGSSFERIPSTWSTTDANIQNTFKYINELKAHPTVASKIYASTAQGLLISSDGGINWLNALPDTISDHNKISSDVQISVDGNVVIAAINERGYVSHDAGSNFTKVSGAVPGNLPNTQISRMEFAIAPSNSNYIYCAMAGTVPNGTLKNIYISTDKGLTWSKMIENPGETFQPFTSGGFSGQGFYDNVIAVYPDNPEHIILGGIDLWKGHVFNGIWYFEQISYWQDWISYYFVHADQHAIVFHPNYDGVNNKTMFFANDGGVFRSLDGGITFNDMNKNYITTQFYTVAFSNHGEVVGGTQDNGTQYINYKGNTLQTSIEIKGGDGGGCAISSLNPKVFFASTYTGRVSRSDEPTVFMNYYSDFYDAFLLQNQNIGVWGGGEPFVPQVALHEDYNDPLSIDSVKFTAIFNYYEGDQISVFSKIGDRKFNYTIQASDYAPDDSLYKDSCIMIQDPYQAVFAVGLNGQVWITRNPLDLSGVSTWVPIINDSYSVSSVNALAWSNDGDILYISDVNGRVYRCSNILNARTKSQMNAFVDSTCLIETQKLGTFSQTITDIAVDPSNSNNIIVTLGNYGNTDYVYFSANAATTTSDNANTNFISIQGNLPEIPVYTAIVQWNDSRKVIIGTECGIFTSNDITATSVVWNYESTNVGRTPVYMLRQQTRPNFWCEANTGVSNHGVIYAATHGRGLFKCESLRGPLAIKDNTQVTSNLKVMSVYPNPVIDNAYFDFELFENSQVKIDIYSLTGKLMSSETINKNAGKHKYVINASQYQSGTYMIKLYANNKSNVAKFVVF
ncbi:MAG: T9SS type A sorting domain-containing protein [Bacteroidota bacterium]